MLKTEMRNPNSTNIDKATTKDMISLIIQENYNAVKAVEEQKNNIAKAIDLVADAFKNGHRLFFIGAGTSGRLGVLDAAECPPTFGVSYEMIKGIIAGGEKCIVSASENEEDKGENGPRDLKKENLTAGDVVVGISASGTAEYVAEALAYAKTQKAISIAMTCNENTLVSKNCDLCICTDTGAEVVTGSTRMKAGTAQKIVLNLITTCAMIKIGNVYQNFMINLKPSNNKLTLRMIGIVKNLCGCNDDESKELLIKSNWNIREAVRLYNLK